MAQDLKLSLEEQLLKIRREAEEKETQQRALRAGTGYLNLTATPIQIEALKLVNEEEARRLMVAPFQFKQKEIALAVLDLQEKGVSELIKKLESQGYQVKLFLVSSASLLHIWSFYKFLPPPAEEITGKVSIDPNRLAELFKKLTDLEKIKKEILGFDFKTFPTGQILEVVLSGAMNNRASDIHFETEEKGVRLRLRIDGLLHDVMTNLSHEIYIFLLSRIKLLSNLKLNVSDIPQDGRFTIALNDKEVELRISIIPSEYGETIVMRILDPAAIRITLPQLGLRPDDLEIIQEQLKSPNGMILNTGPTGSGKTTTLYAFLLSKLNPEVKIITIEDPIEYHIEGLEQTQVDPEAGYDFANGLRSIMRQDPDSILVGEVRDKETADIAIQAALTGHLVLSTFHAASAAAALTRMLDSVGINPLFASAMHLIMSQRLIRRLDDKTKIAYQPDDALKHQLQSVIETFPPDVQKPDINKISLYRAGKSEQNPFGYAGQLALREQLLMTPGVQKLLRLPPNEITTEMLEAQAVREGMLTMLHDGLLKAFTGVTSLEEVYRVVG